MLIFLLVISFYTTAYAIKGDVDRDGDVDFDDFFLLVDVFGEKGTPTYEDCNLKPCSSISEADSTLTVCPIEGLSLEITSPTEDTTLAQTEIRAAGTVTGLPPEYVLRILVNPPGSLWWPQSAPVIRSDNTWRATIFVGVDTDAGSGREFIIGVVALPEEQAQILDKATVKNSKYRVFGQLNADVLVKR